MIQLIKLYEDYKLILVKLHIPVELLYCGVFDP